MSKPGIIERLRSQHDGMLPKGEFAFVTKKDIAELMSAIDVLRAERDEARREVCVWQGLDTATKSNEVARVRGWDCFKEDGK